MKLDNIINFWNPGDPAKNDAPKGFVFILFSFYIFKEYVTIDFLNIRLNFARRIK